MQPWYVYLGYFCAPLSIILPSIVMYLASKSNIRENDKKIENVPLPASHQVHYITEDIAKQYVDSVIKGSARTSSIIYFIALIIILIVAVLRNTESPGWTGDRLKLVLLAIHCAEDKNDSAECLNAKQYVRHLGFDLKDPKLWGDTKKLSKALDKQVEELIKKHTELRTSVILPVFGVSLDPNDLWVISTMAFGILLYLLRLSLAREYYNIRRLVNRCQNSAVWELVIMGQLLSAPPMRVRLSSRLLFLVFCLPAALHAYVVLDDISTFPAYHSLIGDIWPWVQISIELPSIVMVSYLSGKCFGISGAIMALLDKIRKELVPKVDVMESF